MELPLQPIKDDLTQFKAQHKSLCITSSFQTHSLPLLHIITRIVPDIPVLFIDTGFHYPETYQFRDKITKAWNLNLINLTSNTPKTQQVDKNGRFLYTTNPDRCCHINKVLPLNAETKKYDVWIAGLRRDQTLFRKSLSKTEVQENGRVKYHPILAWTSKMIYQYRQAHNLPAHPLEAKGYFSIGCMPCTAAPSTASDNSRNGRWQGANKTECGIHFSK